MMKKSAANLVGLAILAGAFAVRLIYLLQVKDLPFYYHPVLDAGFFQRWAAYKQQISWFDVAAPFREPLYVYFLGLVYSGLRDSMTLVRVIQCALGGFTAMLVYFLGRRLYGVLAGAIGGILFAMAVPAIFFASELNEITLTVLLLVASAYLLARASESGAYLNSLFSGLLIGAAFIANYLTIAALPAWLAGSLASGSRRLKRASVFVAIGFLAVPLGYQFIMIKGGQGTIFPLRASWQAFLGSGAGGGTAEEPWFEIDVVGGDGAYSAIAIPDRIDGQRDAMRFASIEDSTVTRPLQASAHWWGRAIEDFAAAPFRSVRLYFTKLGLFWGSSEPPANMDMRFLSRYSALLRTRVFSFGVIAALGLVGLVLGSRRRTLHLSVFLPLASVVASFSLVSDTAKMMVVPFLCVFAGFVAAEFVARVRRGKTAALGLVAGAILAGLVVYFLPARPMDRVANLVAAGDVYEKVAIFDQAEDCYRRAMAEDPHRPEPYVSMASLYGNAGRTEAAIKVLDSALKPGAEDPRTGIEKANLLAMAGRYEDALAVLDKVRTTHPYEPRLHQLTGYCLLQTGRAEAALKNLEEELEYVGGDFITFSALGRAEFQLGNYDEAAHYLESALALNPFDPTASVDLADTYTKMGQHFKACEVIEKILGVDPGNMPLRFKLANCLFRADRPGDALTNLKKLYKYDPGNANILVNMGTVYAYMDSLEQAKESWERALVLDPDNEMARENLKLAGE
jgi:tetratricopeptide (TPR) repeat protein